MNPLIRIWRSSVGKKYIMAITGCALFGFVIAHLLGNLQIFLGPGPLNRYGHFLQTTPEVLWPARFGLLAMVALHILAALKLSRENKLARPVPYAREELVAASYASRTMLMSGIIVAVFVVYHLLHFTVQVQAINLVGENFALLEDQKQQHDVYRMMLAGFSSFWVSGFYMIGLGLLCLHLSHGVGSMFQSVGWKNKSYGKFIDGVAKVLALLIFLGYCSIPLAVLADRRFKLIHIFQ
jgi:succinate dehydrogenase cytochrome b subunit